MIIEYEMRNVHPGFAPDKWVPMCGEFADWEAFYEFKKREGFSRREVRNATEVKGETK